MNDEIFLSFSLDGDTLYINADFYFDPYYDPETGEELFSLTYSVSCNGAFDGGTDNAPFGPSVTLPVTADTDGIFLLEVEGSEGWTGDSIFITKSVIIASHNDADQVVAGTSGEDVVLASGFADYVNLGAANDLAQTYDGDDYVNGGAGDDTINGGAGADVMIGGGGNDVFYVDNAGDDLYEKSGGGLDTVLSWISLTLGDHLERLTLLGSDSINATGNAHANLLRGNDVANVLDGGAGADEMRGGYGDDTYVVDDAGDTVFEFSLGGIDTVQSFIGYNLGAELEHLTLVGGSAVNGNGNDLANTITGNNAANILYGLEGHDSIAGADGADTLNGGSGNDTLDGGGGADVMSGSTGHDVYVVNDATDRVRETSPNQGLDTVRASITYALPAYVENLTISGGAARNGSGNIGDNQINGNSAANRLMGREGADTLVGGGGSDTLEGGDGNDVLMGGAAIDTLTGGAGVDAFVLHAALDAANREIVTDFSVVDDSIHLENAVMTALGATGALAAGAFHVGSAAADAQDRIIYNNVTGALFYDGNGNSAGAQVQIAQLAAGLALTNADFLVI